MRVEIALKSPFSLTTRKMPVKRAESRQNYGSHQRSGLLAACKYTHEVEDAVSRFRVGHRG